MILALLLSAPSLAGESGSIVRLSGGSSFLIADKDGVPDANRLFVAAGVTIATVEQTTIAVEPAFAIGYSEAERWSYRVGANVEAEWAAKPHTSLYGSLGLHYFRSYTEPETRKGPLVRAALGMRLAAGGRSWIGFEPLAIERFPNGEGVMTPLRSRWGVEVTFISAGVRL